MGKLFQELKRRNVYKVATLYVVASWVLLQVTETVFPIFDISTDLLRPITLALLVGFLPVLVLTWVYEYSAEGFRKTQADKAEAAPVTFGTDIIVIFLLLVVVGFTAAERFGMNADSSLAIEADSNNSTANTNERVRRTTLNIGPVLHDRLGSYSSITLSPDGTRLAFTSPAEGKTQLHIRELNQLESRTLGAPFESVSPVILTFSPDSEWLAYSSDDKLNKISIANGSTQQLVTGEQVASLDWAEDKTILFSARTHLRRVPDSGGASSLIPVASAAIESMASEIIAYPENLPGGKGLLLTRLSLLGSEDETRTVELFNVESGYTQLLIPNAYNATYSPTGHIAFMRSGDLWAVPFNLDSMQISGAAVSVVEAIGGSTPVGGATYTLSGSGDLIYLPAVGESDLVEQSNKILSWVDRTGAETPLEIRAQEYMEPRLSPDGNQVAVAVSSSAALDIWIYDLIRGALSRVTYDVRARSPLWSPTGNELIFMAIGIGIGSARVNGIGESEIILNQSSDGYRQLYTPTTFSPDGMQLLYEELSTPSVYAGPDSSNILSFSMAPEHTGSSVIATNFMERGPVISPNGLWLAYTSNETGRDEVFVRPYPDTANNKYLVSTAGGNHPQWATDTGELFYQNDTDAGIETYAVNIATGSDFVASIPELLFTSDHFFIPFVRNYSVAADGQRFIMIKLADEEGAEPIAIDTNLVLIENFAAELRQRVPANVE